MRSAPLLCVLLLTAGCIAPADPAGTDPVDAGPAPPPALPRDMEEEIAYLGAFEAAGATAGDACAFQPWCFDYPFTVGPGGVAVQARLSWTVPANDLDLLLLRGDGDEVVASAQARGPGAGETLEATLEPGGYRLRVVPYAVLDEPDARLRASFQAAGSS